MKSITKVTLPMTLVLIGSLAWAQQDSKGLVVESEKFLPEIKFCTPTCPPGEDEDGGSDG